MIKACLFFTFLTTIYLCPVIPMTIKGMLGVIFIIISSVESGLKGSLITAFTLSVLQIINFLFHNNIDFVNGMITVFTGLIMYSLVSIYLGVSADKLRNKNNELQSEIEMRKNFEKDLKEKISIMEGLMSTLPTPVCFKDLNFNYTGCNPAYEAYFGINEQNIIGKSCYDLFEPEMADCCRELDTELLKAKTVLTREVGFTSPDGRQKYFVFTKSLLTDEEGKPSGIVSVLLDTTEHREHELLKRSMEEEKMIIDEMQKYDKLKTEFFSNISHELRTPLNVIFCAVQLLEMSLNNNESPAKTGFLKKNVRSIRQNSLRLLRLVNNLIDITKIDAQSFEINRRNQDIVYVVREIVLSVADYVTNKGLKLVFHSDINEKTMAFDDEKIERIILNLLSNAIKFSPQGGSIFVEVKNRTDGVAIRVRDMGIGIPLDRQQDIFQRFYQISPVNTRLREGSGIGLNLVKSLVEMHQGTITVESEYGNGTTFTVELPGSLLPEDTAKGDEGKDRQGRIESIRLEFSDIYLMNDPEAMAQSG